MRTKNKNTCFNAVMTLKRLFLKLLVYNIAGSGLILSQTIANVESRNVTSLNGYWQVIVDVAGNGDWRQVWLDKKQDEKRGFVEYSFDGGPQLKVPGDFNSQMCELTFFEGIVWYKKVFDYKVNEGRRLFLYFGAVNYWADVYLNGEKLGSHEGGFTPFQFEITSKVKDGKNTLIVKADNKRIANGLPGVGFDWFNYGGITRDVYLIETSNTFIEDYFIQLKKGSLNTISGWLKVNGAQSIQTISIEIPELKVDFKTRTNKDGIASFEFNADLILWSPENPKLYKVNIKCNTDFLTDTIGFRSIEVKGGKILLNGKAIFIKGVNIHEENPMRKARAFSTSDASMLLDAAKELGCNFVRLVHYPHSENMVKQAEKMGIMVWDELPVYQHILFSDSLMPAKLEKMLTEMVQRDKNRCAVIIWSLSNETYPGTPKRNEALRELTQKCRELDSTRLITHVINTQGYQNNTFNVWDPLYKYSDLIAINEYIG
jgi:beta-glucuronidase